MKFSFVLFFIATLFYPAKALQAQVSMGGAAGSYTQNFAGLGTASGTWTNNTNIINWYSQRSGTDNTLTASTGTINVGDLYNYGSSGAADRALGSQGSANAAAGNFAWGILFQNNSGIASHRSSVVITYTGEQWRNSGAGAQSLMCYYKRSMSPITDLEPNVNTTWSSAFAFNFSSPVTGGSAGNINGNAVGNRLVVTATLSFTPPLAHGEYVMFKWDDPDHAGSDHGLAIDDVTLSWLLAVLPVSLTSFDGSLVHESVQLKWITKTEINHQAFVIETSRDGRLFDSIGQVNGNGNSFTEKKYAFLHEKPGPGINYYRLKQIDLDGATTYSKIIGVQHIIKTSTLVYPNPSRGVVYVDNTIWSPEQAQLTDRMGRILQSWDFHSGKGPNQLFIHEVPVGEYWLRLSSTTRSETVILLKQ